MSKPLVNRGITRYLSQVEAQNIDIDLMQVPGFSIDQLMELAGLSVAAAVLDAFPVVEGGEGANSVLVVAGPGNNGGDGLVAARHLTHFGYRVDCYYPVKAKETSTTNYLFQNIEHQAASMGVRFLPDLPPLSHLDANYTLILDAIFGFSFRGAPRPPFDAALSSLRLTMTPVVSIDIPSGWDVEKGDVNNIGVLPDTLISLTMPKMCAAFFKGRNHYLGGRFIPPAIQSKYDLPPVPYAGSQQFIKL